MYSGFHLHHTVIVRVPIIADLLDQHMHGLRVVNFDGQQARLSISVVRRHRTDESQNHGVGVSEFNLLGPGGGAT